MKKTAVKWIKDLKQHRASCRCPQRTRADLTQVIVALPDADRNERETLLVMLTSPDEENHVVLISILQQKAPQIFELEPVIHSY